jgi:hypothetical protein
VVMTVEGATDADIFRAYVTQVLGPTLAPGDIIVLDNLSKVKTALRAAKARTREALEAAVQQAMETVTAIDVQNWFRHCGYAL